MTAGNTNCLPYAMVPRSCRDSRPKHTNNRTETQATFLAEYAQAGE